MEIRTITQQLLFNTVLIETKDINDKPLGSGTSFVISHEFEGYGEELFLVTNKHVIKNAFHGYTYFTQLKDGKPDIGNPFFIKSDSVESQFYGHPNEDIDIAISPLSWQLDMIGKSGIKAYYTKISTNIIASDVEVSVMDAIHPIIFIGYPVGLYDTKNYTPIIRTGITATPVQLDFCNRPIFLIDASVFPGSSGSPVFTYEKTWRGEIVNLKLLGILAEVFIQKDEGTFELIPAPTQVIPRVTFEQMIDLGVVFKGYLIEEAIEDFWKQNKHKLTKHRKI